jgi:FMN phosphatase YigB (HAD superfamily)
VKAVTFDLDDTLFGDNLELDVVGARSAGLTAQHLDRAAGDPPRRSGPSY